MSKPRPFRAAWYGGLALVGIVAAIVLRFARSLITPPARLEAELRIIDIDREHQRIVLNDHPAARLRGKYGLWFGRDAGYLRIGDLISRQAGRVTRELIEVVSGTPRKGMVARDTGWFFIAPWEIGGDWSNVTVPGPLGALPAWHLPATGSPSDWVIHVHGRTAQRGEALRGVRAVREAGWQSLVVSYRNDRGAPRSSDGKYGLGGTEWDDVRSAIDYATSQGARRIVLFGWSMGGLIALRTAAELSRSGTSPVVGVVLDSPVLSWPSVIAHHARIAYLPRWIGFLVTAVLEAEWTRFLTGIARPIRWRELDGGNLLAQAGIPALVLHSADDDYVPVEPSRQLGRDLPDHVEYHEFTEAGHVRLWNHEPERWERLITDWLSAR